MPQSYTASATTVVNTTTASLQIRPAEATLSDGSYVIVWDSQDQDGSGQGVYAQRYDSSGAKLGGEFLVNTTTTDDQSLPAITALSGGGFVVTWNSLNQDGNGLGVYAQRFDSTGAKVGSETRVNTTISSNQLESAVAGLGDGGYLVSWTDMAQGIAYQRFDAAGHAVGAETVPKSVAGIFLAGEDSSSVANLSNGGYAIAWHSSNRYSNGIALETFDASGAAVGTAVSVYSINAMTGMGAAAPAVVQLNSGNLVVAYETYDPSASGSKTVSFQEYDTTGAVVKSGVAQSTAYTTANIFVPALTALSDGGFTLAWATPAIAASPAGINVQRYDADGNTVGSVTEIVTANASNISVMEETNGKLVVTWSDGDDVLHNTLAANTIAPVPDLPVVTGLGAPAITSGPTAGNPEVTYLSNGNYVIVYNQSGDVDGSGNGVFAQTFDAFGNAISAPHQVNTAFTAGDQTQASVTALNDGGYVISFQSADPSNSGVHVQRYDASGGAVGSAAHVGTSAGDYDAEVAGLAGGGYVAIWSSDQGASASDFDIHAQRFDASGNKVGGEAVVNTTTANTQSTPAIAALDGGGYVIAWNSWQSGSTSEIHVQQYDASGNKVGTEVSVTPSAASTARQDPQVAGLSDGGYVVTWTEPGTSGNTYIMEQRFDSAGAEIGGIVQVNSTGNYVGHSTVTAYADDTYIVAWDDVWPEAGHGLYYQVFDPNGDKLGSEVQLTSGYDQKADLAATSDGNFVFTWMAQTGFDFTIYKSDYVAGTAGTSGADSLHGTTDADLIAGLGGDDTLIGDNGSDYLFGGAGNDQLLGGFGNDRLSGDDGNDTLWGEAGNDQMAGGAGDDVLLGQDGNDALWGEAGNDTLYGGDGNDSLYGQEGTNWLDGGNGDDYLLSTAQEHDTLIGGTGNDTLESHAYFALMMGGDGNDLVISSAGLDTLYGEGGDDTLIGYDSDGLKGSEYLFGQDGNDVLFGQKGNDTLVGGDGDDKLYGQGEDDALLGGNGNDTLDGGSGHDFIQGGAGADLLTGGTGTDTFYYTDKSEPADFITDFNHAEADRFILQASAFNVPVGFVLTDGVGLLQGAGVHPGAATATFYLDTTTHALWFDADGTGPEGAHVLAFLLNNPTLHTEDFMFT